MAEAFCLIKLQEIKTEGKSFNTKGVKKVEFSFKSFMSSKSHVRNSQQRE